MQFLTVTTPIGLEVKQGQTWKGNSISKTGAVRPITGEIIRVQPNEIHLCRSANHFERLTPKQFEAKFHTVTSFIDPAKNAKPSERLVYLAIKAERFLTTCQIIALYRKEYPQDMVTDNQLRKCFRDMINRKKYKHKVYRTYYASGTVKTVYIRIYCIDYNVDKFSVNTAPLREYLETTDEEYTAASLNKKFGVNLSTVYRFMARFGKGTSKRGSDTTSNPNGGWSPCEGEAEWEERICANRTLLNSVFC